MRLTILITCCILATTITYAKTVKKSAKDAVLAKGPNQKVNARKPAILAIEIVDSEEEEPKHTKKNIESTSRDKNNKKNSKRTIETSLGYGYQSTYNQKPKFEIYKYSQEDIPPVEYNTYHSNNNNNIKHVAKNTIHNNGQVQHGTNLHGVLGNNDDYYVQKSVVYELGTQTYIEPPVVPPKKQLFQPNYQQQNYNSNNNVPQQHLTKPPIMLYSTVDQNGHLGELSQQIPYEGTNTEHNGLVPVVILRVYTNQLANADSYYPNIPENSPYSNLNNINLQSLLGGYFTHNTNHHGDNAAYQHNKQYDTTYTEGQKLDTHENYPGDKHTKVIFHKNTHANPQNAPNIPKILPEHVQKPAVHPAPYLEHTMTPAVHNTGYYYVEPQQGDGYHGNQQYIHGNQAQQQVVYYQANDAQQNQQYEYYPEEGAGQGYAQEQVVYENQDPHQQYVQYEEQSPHQQIMYVTQETQEYTTAAPYNYHAHKRQRNVQIIHESPEEDAQETVQKVQLTRSTMPTKKAKSKRTKKTAETA